jgi:hypothetical protein
MRVCVVELYNKLAIVFYPFVICFNRFHLKERVLIDALETVT